jgi:RNA polymerase sigma-70 factor (ECF subfamily)
MEETIRKNTDKMYRAAIAITHCKADAEDAVHDAFVKLFEKQPRFDSSKHETAWLIRVTVNRCKNTLKSRSKTTELLDIYPTQNDSQFELIEIIKTLPDKYRIAIHLFYYEGYSTKEIAQMTKQKDSTVREQLTRARRLLKKYLEEEIPPEGGNDSERLQGIH